MIVGYILIWMFAALIIAAHLATTRQYQKHNETAGIFNRRAHSKFDMIRFYSAFVVFALMTGVLVEIIVL